MLKPIAIINDKKDSKLAWSIFFLSQKRGLLRLFILYLNPGYLNSPQMIG